MFICLADSVYLKENKSEEMRKKLSNALMPIPTLVEILVTCDGYQKKIA